MTGSGRPRRSIYETVEAAASGLAVGLGINEISGSRLGHRATAAAVAAAAVLLVFNRVRQLPSAALLPRLVSWACLAAAIAGIVVAGLGPRGWSGYAVIVAATLTTAAVMFSADADRALNLILGVALIGLGIAAIGGGVAVVGLGLGILLVRVYLRDAGGKLVDSCAWPAGAGTFTC